LPVRPWCDWEKKKQWLKKETAHPIKKKNRINGKNTLQEWLNSLYPVDAHLVMPYI
jgi:hypothetical protein